MLLRVFVDNEVGKIIIVTDNSDLIKPLLESASVEKGYNPFLKRWAESTVVRKIYESKRKIKTKLFKGCDAYTLGLGWAAYVANILKNYMPEEDFNNLLKSILSDEVRDVPFENLRDYQNSDVLHLLKYKIGLCVVNTSYGKTQVIATLAHYASQVLGKKVLIVTPGKRAQDEVVKRCKSVFGIEVNKAGSNVDSIITSGLLNRKSFKDPAQLEKQKKILETYDWVLVDEVEYTINPAGEMLYSMLTKADHFYGFSGTADKDEGKIINFGNGLSEVVMRNKDLVKFFGPALVYRSPLNLDITLIDVLTTSLNQIDFDSEDIDKDGNIYMTIMNKIWTHPEVCKTIVKIAKKFPMLFIPINNLNAVINHWIENYLIGEFKVLLISSAGYTYYELNGTPKKLSLEESCEYIRDGKVDIIPSTSSGYRALDFPGLKNIFLIQGAIAGVVLQSIGRVARSNKFNIIYISPKKSTKIPVYTKGVIKRDEMVNSFYRYCDIKRQRIDESKL